MKFNIDTRQFIAGFVAAVVITSIAAAFFFALNRPNESQARTIIYRDAPAPTGAPDVSVDVTLNKTGDCIMVSKPGEKEAQMHCVMV